MQLGGVTGFEQAHEWLCEELAARGIEHYRLAGYSLGGRLALYHASQSPAGLRAILLENCHPGLPEAERAARLAHDEGWARRFEQEPLPLVLADWYRQGVFADLDETARRPAAWATRALPSRPCCAPPPLANSRISSPG